MYEAERIVIAHMDTLVFSLASLSGVEVCLEVKVMVMPYMTEWTDYGELGDFFISRYGMFVHDMRSSPTNLTYRHLILLAFPLHFILFPGSCEESETLYVHFVIYHIQTGSHGGGRDRHL